MRAVRSTERGIEVAEVPRAERGGMRVRVSAASICGTDLELVRLGPLPFTLGHEVAGLTDDGSPVAVLPLEYCGTCDRCLAGQTAQCRIAMAGMYGLGADGAMADEMVVREDTLVPLPKGLDVRDACLVEPLAVALHAANRARLHEGQNVAVVGAGTIGLLCAAVARDIGCDVAIAARHPAQRSAAEAIGARVGLGGPCDVVFEAAGTESAFSQAVDHCDRGGTIALVATSWRPVTVSFMAAQLAEMTLVPAIVYGHCDGEREFDAAAEILARHPEIPPALITKRFPLDDAAEAFRVAGDRAGGAIKVVLEP